MNRRDLLKGSAAALVGVPLCFRALARAGGDRPGDRPTTDDGLWPTRAGGADITADGAPVVWNGAPRNVIIVRYGGGIRRLESIGEGGRALSPFLHECLVPNGTLYDDLFIPWGARTGHPEGTLFVTTGAHDVPQVTLGGRTAPVTRPTIFEGFLAASPGERHRAIIVNNEQLNTEFVSYSTADGYGRELGARVLSLHALEQLRLEAVLADHRLERRRRRRAERQLARLVAADPRPERDSPADRHVTERFWRPFLARFGYRAPKGDAFQTEATLAALELLRPRLLMVHFQDCDYAHWGPRHFYDEGVRRMDHGLRRIVAAVASDPFYRENTVVLVTPDIGRGTNLDAAGRSKRLRAGYQHHNPDDRGSHETFLLAWGSGITAGRVVDRRADPVDVAPTVARLMGFAMPSADGTPLAELVES